MNDLTIKEYFAVDGSRFSDGDARQIGPILADMVGEGAVTARDVLNAASPANSPLHKYFEWDDDVAADKWRVEQARQMVRAIKVRFIDGDGEKKESRAFHVHRTTAWEREPRRYRSFEVLHGETAFAVQMMDDAFADLIRWRMKYEPYSFMWAKFGETFQGIVNQIDEFADDCRATNNADEMDNALVGLLVWRDQFAAALETWVEFHSHIEFVMDAIADAEKVFVGATEQKERNCLRCGSPFMSAHAGHRICEKCFHMFDKGISGAVESREFMKPKEDV